MDRYIVEIPRNPVVAVGIPLAMGWASGFITRSSVNTWFKTQRKPPGQPPAIAFPIVWTSLYTGMGYASHLLAKAYASGVPGRVQSADLALRLYCAQLVFNGLWTPLFFGAKRPAAALVDILVLAPTTFALTYHAYQANPSTIYLLAPYCLWLTYATYLNAGIVYLNSTFTKSSRKDL